ncbi:MAG TPA: DNA-directed RNA polymerase subunit H [Candidatus Syntrophoarchaeum butanivorans]|uniref:DNA-directed RNA polymerase subunit Rpo5 n=1 Tax=Candidatus Syntropharchaeum butanivorans TaxID=1839936 RepID=A0A1F2P5G1_9EURY|nr:MAG: protein containing RNA polymerase, subunit H/Rpb5 [Candidatus Syntrophoarchaeum butanivorans]RJS72184.1 MAG: DNA-directed RNA polymerase subunit H [Candidatus Syntrophoarchaeum sp. WYZ-LMO15]HDM36720.1 DNA-directed RNA polymerase subunit H [Candidatus Syntrophoarchaeum butanivorans]
MKGGTLLDHELVPKHEVLTEEEEKAVLRKYKVSKRQLPKIKYSDPIAREIGAEVGQIIKITRDSKTAGKSIAYRVVIDQ